MSASNWSRCPKCRAKAKEAVDYMYGKVSVEHYEKVKNLLDYLTNGDNKELKGFELNYDERLKLNDDKLEKYYDLLEYHRETPFTVREDYTFGHDDKGNINFDYAFECQSCDFENNINFDEETQKIIDKEKND